MMGERYCHNCKKMVNITAGFSWMWFAIFLLVFAPIALVYGLRYYIKQRKCPVCKLKEFSDYPPDSDEG